MTPISAFFLGASAGAIITWIIMWIIKGIVFKTKK